MTNDSRETTVATMLATMLIVDGERPQRLVPQRRRRGEDLLDPGAPEKWPRMTGKSSPN